MKLTDILSHTMRSLVVCAAALMSLSSCNGLMYDEQGDCDPHYKVKFIYTYHLKGEADAFRYDVDAVTLYLVDASGNVVWQKSESGERLAEDGYMMDVDINPGEYSLLAWCGSGVGTHFTVNDAKVASDLHCYMGRERDEAGNAVSASMLNPLFHGRLDAQVFPDDEGTYIYTVPLVKDTNDINIILQQLSGEPIDETMFEFTITDGNGWLDWQNMPIDDEVISYRPHHTTLMGAEISDLTDGYSHAYGALRAEHTTSRLMAPTVDNRDGDLILTVRRVSGAPEVTPAPPMLASRAGDADDNVVLRVPLTPYCLAFKTEKYKDMDTQEYLDRCDTYNMVFFLDEGYRWMDSFIYINSFRVVKQNVEI